MAKKLEDFSPAKLEALSEPLCVSVFRVINGRQEVIPLPPRGSLPAGEGFTAKEVQQMSPVVASIAGGGSHQYVVQDAHGVEYRWEWWVDPVTNPPKPLTGMTVPTPQAAPVAPNGTPFVPQSVYPPTVPTMMGAPAFAPMGGTPAVSPQSDWLLAFYAQQAAMQRGMPIAPPQPQPYYGAPGYGQPYPYAGQPQPYPSPYYPPFTGGGYGQPYPSPAHDSDHDRAIKAEMENKFNEERRRHHDDLGKLALDNRDLLARLAQVEKDVLGRQQQPTSNPQLEQITRVVEDMRRENGELKRQVDAGRSDAAMTTAIANAVGPLHATIQALQQRLSERPTGPDPSQTMMLQALDRNAQAIKDQSQQTASMIQNIINQQPKALELLAQLQTLSKSSGSQEVIATLNHSYMQLMESMKVAVGFVQAQQPPGPNVIAEGAVKAGQALVGLAERYVEGTRQVNEMKASAEIMGQQAAVMRAQMQQPQAHVLPAAQPVTQSSPMMASPHVPQTVPLGQPAQPVVAPAVEEPAQEAQGAPEAEGGPPMTADEQAQFEREMFGPAGDAIGRLRQWVEEDPGVSPEEIVARVWMGFTHFASKKAEIGLYSYFDRQMWREFVDILFPRFLDGQNEKRYALMRALHRKWSIDSGRGDPEPQPTPHN